MTAIAELPLQGLAHAPCTEPVPYPNATEVHAPTGMRAVRRCVLPNGHLEREVPCRYSWFDEYVDGPAVVDVDSEDVF